MTSLRWLALAAVVAGCGSGDDAAKFVGAWAYPAGAKVAVNCGGTMFDSPLDTVVETFSESNGVLVKNDSQGCAGLRFSAAGDVASLSSAGQSCAIPASGMSPAATFAPSVYSFTFSGGALTAAVTASYTPSGSSACTVSGSNTLTRK
jgi:hypothetical protein